MRAFYLLPFFLRFAFGQKTPPTVYWIRHGEKLDVTIPGINTTEYGGLNYAGWLRAECLPTALGKLNIKHIITQNPSCKSDAPNPKDPKHPSPSTAPSPTCPDPEPPNPTKYTCEGETRPYLTIYPFAVANKLAVDRFEKSDHEGVAKRIRDLANMDGNILVSWEHHNLVCLMEALGATNATAYPDDRFDLIYSSPPGSPPYYKFVAWPPTCEQCPGIDHPSPTCLLPTVKPTSMSKLAIDEL